MEEGVSAVKQCIAIGSKWQPVRGICGGWSRKIVCSIFAVAVWIIPQISWAKDTSDFSHKELKTYRFLSVLEPGDMTAQTLIGSPQTHTVVRKDTFLDLGRFFDLGYNELAAAYPNMDPWALPTGHKLTLPTWWILPQGERVGIIVNVPEMRLYYFPRAQASQIIFARSVMTVPVGIGRRKWETPDATFRIRGKTEDPTWVIPASIRAERIHQRGWSAASIPGGSPGNPLGKYRIELSLPSYAIHDTTNPWAIGRLTTHGCVRLYPEDIEQFFPLVPIGTPGAFVYQPVKIGIQDGRIYVEVHADIYQRLPDMWQEALSVVRRSGWAERVNFRRLAQVVEERSGVPVDVTQDIHIDRHARPTRLPRLLDQSPVSDARDARLEMQGDDILPVTP